MARYSASPVFLFFCLYLLAHPAQAQLKGKIASPEFYTYHTGNDTKWAQPDFDDSDWQQIDSNTFPVDNWQGIGWFRFVFEVDSALWNVPLGLSIQYVGAVEFYLDGAMLYQFGGVGTSKEQEEPRIDLVPHPRTISFRAPLDAGSAKSRHLVAIRYSSFFTESTGGSPGFDFHFGVLARLRAERDSLIKKVAFHQMLLVGVFLAFALLHFLLYLFNHSRADRDKTIR